MDAPTTTSADNGTSGGDGSDGGWFTPRKTPQSRPVSDEQQHVRPVGSARPPAPAAEAPAAAPPAPAASPAPEAPAAPETLAGSQAPDVPDTSSAPAQGRTAHAAPEPISEAVSPPSGSNWPAGNRPEAPASPVRDAGQAQKYSAESAPTEPALTETEPEPASEPTTVTESGSPDAILIRRTMAEVGPVADKVTSYFYALLFVRHPDLRMLFPAAMDTQRDRLLKALLTAAEHIDNTEILVAYLKNLGRGHRKYGTRPEHYPAVGEALIGALTRYATDTWDEETEAAWVRAYTTISQVMIDAASADELRAPAWWFGEVVSHDLRTPDIAVLTVRPDQPYPFLAGQYTSLETPWWPRIWRHYSFASAPRSDGLLSFHVKAVPAGWVSNALVHRARPGDTIRLGPPTGSMTVDHNTDNGMLCLGGGTGIAPIKALVEDVAEHGERRPVEVFYGARTDHDLYDIDTMLRLQQSHPWLSVRPIVDRLDRQHVQLPDAVREYGPWNEYDAYLSGPPGMIRSGVHALRDVGIPSNRIRHDSVEELVAAGD
ncbi:globin domain-containing protein [Streptomyces sp. NBC_01304]|uniref:globin domain-containing protein n=1 Tax=Streptomyces sp. NBC_01304 TaxID=2903818 RepID=UPI002E0E1C03|nr:FAD-binding oxidoreductase [Streptomyces sp. NBC_01304]